MPEPSSPPSLATGRQLTFGAFHIDLDRHRLWRGEREIPLRPKTWEMLRYLLERPDFLVTKDALHRAIWPDTSVSDDTLTKVVAELRQALEDNPRAPRLIETVHGRGFRFIAEVRARTEPARVPPGADAPQAPAASRRPAIRPFVGRERELATLSECLRVAAQGNRQFVLVTGEAGIGKTTLTERFLRLAARQEPGVHVLHGQCIQQHGQREPYMPMLEALERALSSPLGSTLIPLVRRFAPCWYVQIPWLLSEGEPPGFQSVMMTAAPQRMLREISAFLESMASESTVILLLEDLHWSDHATTDLLSYLAERRDPARLLMIGTYRPADASTREHPIREVRLALRARGRCVDLEVGYLSAADLREYLRLRFGESVERLAHAIHERTDGNPLFAIAIVEELIRRGALTEAGGWVTGTAGDRMDLAVPEDLREMFTAQFERLSADERAVLEAASVAGVSFAPSTVARALRRDVEAVEAIAQHMVRAHLFLDTASPVEDRSSLRLYDFSHALHHQVIYEQVAEGRRRRLHQAIGEAIESTQGERLAEAAPELSVHFERSGDHARAIRYLGLCVTRAQQRFAHHEAIGYGQTALSLLRFVPDTPERRRTELDIRLARGISLVATRGYAAEEVKENFERARTLCEEVGDPRQLFEIVQAVWYRHQAGADEGAAVRTVKELAAIAERANAEDLRLRAALNRGRTELWLGHFGIAVRTLVQFQERVQAGAVQFRSDTYGVHPEYAAFAQGSLALWFRGSPDQARAYAERGLAHAEKSGQPFEIGSGLAYLGLIHLLCRNADVVAGLATRGAAICRDHDLPFFLPRNRFLGGAARVEHGDVEGGLSEMVESFAAQRAISGVFLADVMLAYIAAAHGRSGHWDEALRCADEGIALTETSLERIFTAELWRIKGELILGKAQQAVRSASAITAAAAVAEQCFRRALGIAQAQEAGSLALRAAMSLAARSRGRSKGREARDRLRSIYASFSEGFDTQDLKDARALLDS